MLPVIRQVESSMTTISEISNVVKRAGFGQDPMCQTFFVIGEPVILSALDLYFYAKDSVLPVFVEIRPVVNNIPTQTVVPFSRVTLPPSRVIITEDASSPTNIAFDGLVYLQPGEYGIIINSNSSRYRVWIAQLGENDVTTTQPILSQPYIGKLYKSQNAASWIPSANQDLKFKLYRAKFNTNVVGTVDLKIDAKSYEESWVENNPLVGYPGSSTLKVLHQNHGLTTGSYTKISGFDSIIMKSSGFSNVFGVNVATIDNVEFLVSNVNQNSYTITLPAAANITSISRAGGSNLSAKKDIRFDAITPQITSLDFGGGKIDVKGKFTNLGYTLGSFVDINKNKVTEFDTAKVLPSSVNIVNNMSNANPFTVRLQLSSDNQYVSPIVDMALQSVILIHNQVNSPTYISENVDNDIVTVSANNLVSFTNISSNIGTINFENVQDKSNATLITKGTYVTVANSSVNSGVFRVLEVLNSGANVKVVGNITTQSAGNIISVTNGTGFVAEEAPTGGSSLSKYITKQIDFINPSTGFNVRLDVCRPENANVRLFYKVKEVGDTAPFTEEEFIEIKNLDITTSRAGEFYEIEKRVDNLLPFNAIVFKILLESSDSADIPKCKNLRLIALA